MTTIPQSNTCPKTLPVDLSARLASEAKRLAAELNDLNRFANDLRTDFTRISALSLIAADTARAAMLLAEAHLSAQRLWDTACGEEG